MTELSTFIDVTRGTLRKLVVIQAPVKYSRPGFRQSLEEGEELVMAEHFRERAYFTSLSWWAMGRTEKFEIKWM